MSVSGPLAQSSDSRSPREVVGPAAGYLDPSAPLAINQSVRGACYEADHHCRRDRHIRILGH